MEKRVFDCFLVSLVLRIDRIASTKAVRVEFVEVNDIVNVIDSDDNREEKKASKAFAFMSQFQLSFCFEARIWAKQKVRPRNLLTCFSANKINCAITSFALRKAYLTLK